MFSLAFFVVQEVYPPGLLLAKFRCGSRAVINHPVRVDSGTSHKAVIHQVQIAVSLLAAPGHEQLLTSKENPAEAGPSVG